MSGFRNESLLWILRIKLLTLSTALIILQIVFMVFILRSGPFIQFQSIIRVTQLLIPLAIQFLLPIAGCFVGYFNKKIILWIFSVINAIITGFLVSLTIVFMNRQRLDRELGWFSRQMSKYINDQKVWLVDSNLNGIQRTGCCGLTSPSNWPSRYGGRYPNSCCGLRGNGFDGCDTDQVYMNGCIFRYIDFQNEMMGYLCTYIVITYLLSITSGLSAFFSPRRERSVPPVVYSPPNYSAHLIPVSTPLQIQMRPPLIQPMRRY